MNDHDFITTLKDVLAENERGECSAADVVQFASESLDVMPEPSKIDRDAIRRGMNRWPREIILGELMPDGELRQIIYEGDAANSNHTLYNVEFAELGRVVRAMGLSVRLLPDMLIDLRLVLWARPDHGKWRHMPEGPYRHVAGTCHDCETEMLVEYDTNPSSTVCGACGQEQYDPDEDAGNDLVSAP